MVPRDLLWSLITGENSADFTGLTSRQREILELVTNGLSNARLAERLCLTEATVK